MTHDELLAKVHSVFYEEEGGTQLDLKTANNQYRALYAVVRLHNPIYNPNFPDSQPWCWQCAEERGYAKYPCPTIQAIEKELI